MKRFTCFCLALAALVSACVSYARIGEPKKNFETRLLTKIDGGLEYAVREDRFREMFDLPYYKLFVMLPKDTSSYFYFKRGDNLGAQRSDVVKQDDMYGWEINACFYKDVSVLEFYRRRGDRITYEEVAALMTLMAEGKAGAKWEQVYPLDKTPVFIQSGNSIFFSDEMRENFPDKPVSPLPKPKPETTHQIKDAKYSEIIEILPKSRLRYVMLEVPEDVENSSNYDQTLARQIMLDEQRKAYELYRAKYNPNPEERKKAEEASKKEQKARTSSTSKSDTKTSSTAKTAAAAATASVTSENANNTSKPAVRDINYGTRPVDLFDKEVRVYYPIPIEDGTAFGYNLRLSDGSVRAQIFSDGILFIDSRFDKMMRENIEKLYEKQAKTREQDAEKSISKF